MIPLTDDTLMMAPERVIMAGTAREARNAEVSYRNFVPVRGHAENEPSRVMPGVVHQHVHPSRFRDDRVDGFRGLLA
jgi:hypothetical protein